MKKVGLMFLLFLLPIMIFAGSLDATALYISSNYSKEFNATIKRHAQEEWGSDYAMVNYEINRQADSLYELANAFKSNNTEIFLEAIEKWSHSGYESENSTLLESLTVVEIGQLIKLHCDWTMVMYEYEKQSEAKETLTGDVLKGLGHYASLILKEQPSGFNDTIKKHAQEKWGTEYDMVVYEINKQSDSLISLINKFESDRSKILINAMYKWSKRGYESDTLVKLEKLNSISLEDLIEYHCDWSMVEYEYDK